MDSAIVIGAGAFGASVAWMLARGGASVTLVDQFEPGDPRATSGGETRLFRSAHGTDASYTRLARRGRELWQEVEAATGADLLVERGLCWFAHREDGWEAASARVFEAEGVPFERLDVADAARRFPSFAGDDLLFVLHEPEAGAIRAADGVRALVRAGREEGVRLKHGRAHPDGRTVVLENGTRMEAEAVVWACGGWLGGLFGGLADVRVTGQELFFLDGGPAWADPAVPCWVDYDLAAYGTADIDDLGVKAAPDVEGPSLSPDAPLPPAGEAGERDARAYVARRFPALEHAPLKHSVTCRYELTPDSHFILAPHPTDLGVWIAGGGSGHGFKHGPAVGELVAAAVRGERALDNRFGLHARAPGRSLRTAGSSR